MHGHEARFVDLDLEQVRRRLRGLAAECVSPRRLVRGVVLENDMMRANGSWLSVRSDGPQHVLAFSRPGGPDLEVTVADFGTTQNILEELGFIVTRHQESHREEWRMDSLTYLLDEWPGLPPCLEIGGPDARTVQWAARQLGLDPSQAETANDTDTDDRTDTDDPTEPIDRADTIVRIVTVDRPAPTSAGSGRADPLGGRDQTGGVRQFIVADLGWSCSQSGWEPGVYRVEWATVLDNPNPHHYCEFPKIQITARDENGQVIGVNDHVMNLFPPGSRLAWASWLETNGPPHTLEIIPRPAEWRPTSARPEQFPPFGYQGVRFLVRGRACSVTGEITNPYAVEVGMIAITALFRDQTGRLVSGETIFADSLPGFGAVPFKLDGEAPTNAGPVTSLDLMAMPWASESAGPWELILRHG